MHRNDLGAHGNPKSAVFEFEWECAACQKLNQDGMDGDTPNLIHDAEGSHWDGSKITCVCMWCGMSQEIMPS